MTPTHTPLSLRRMPLVAALLMLCGGAAAQSINIGRCRASLDLDRLWSYNLYEQSRWGLGGHLTWRDSLTVSAFVGYGVRDLQWKGGAAVDLKLRGTGHPTLYAAGGRDYFAAASRRLGTTHLTDIGGLSAFMSLRMSDRLFLRAGYRHQVRRTTLTAEVTAFRGRRLFEGNTLLYLANGDVLRDESGTELRLAAAHRSGITVEMLGATLPQTHRHAVRLLAQYSHDVNAGPFTLSIFAQGGVTAPDIPYIYMFDLGGTFGAPLWFRHTLLTARPVEYTANIFAFSSLRLRLDKPLFRVYSTLLAIGSNPHPLVGVNLAWGALFDPHHGATTSDGGEQQLWHDGIALTAPTRGVAEVIAGIDGLVHWGVADYGVAICLRPWPLETDGHMRRVLLLTAELAL